jgi:hypothetical protein
MNKDFLSKEPPPVESAQSNELTRPSCWRSVVLSEEKIRELKERRAAALQGVNIEREEEG